VKLSLDRLGYFNQPDDAMEESVINSAIKKISTNMIQELAELEIREEERLCYLVNDLENYKKTFDLK
jgi:hypothetical protein